MFRLTRLTDYGILILGHLAKKPTGDLASARELAEAAGLPITTACKILKTLARHGLLVSLRGATGGYGLARRAEAISMAEIIAALEGPMALCGFYDARAAVRDFGQQAPLGLNFELVNGAVKQALDRISLMEMMQSPLSARHLNAKARSTPRRGG
jgi:Rrf2 family protein